MSSEHIVAEDEHLADIAKQHGFSSINPIWTHPQNSEIRKLRQNSNILFPGDRIFIPDRQVKQESASTDRLTRFVAVETVLELHLKISDQGFQALKGNASLIESGNTTAMTQSGDIFQSPVSTSARAAKVDFPVSATTRQRPGIEVQIGRLNPIETLSGQQQRLNNLGYFAGFVEPDPSDVKKPDSQFRWAVEEFQCDHLGPKKVDGVLGPITSAKLKEVYGS